MASETPKEGLVPTSSWACQRLSREGWLSSNYAISACSRICSLSLSGTTLERKWRPFWTQRSCVVGGFPFLFFPLLLQMLGQSMKQNRRVCRGETDVYCSFHNHRAGWIWENNNSFQDRTALKPPRGFQALSCCLRLLCFFPGE